MAEVEARSRNNPTWNQVVRILGKNETENFMHFFLSICFLCMQYTEENRAFVVALITRRCHILLKYFVDSRMRMKFWKKSKVVILGRILKA